jgi:hypothetical protein
MTLEKVPRVSVVRSWLYLAAKAHGVSPARRCLVLSLQWVVMLFPGDVKPLGLDSCGGVDCLGTSSPGTESPGPGSREPGRVPSRVSSLGCNRRPTVPWV